MENTKKKNMLFPIILIVCGILLIGGGLIFFINSNNKSQVIPPADKEENKDTDTDEGEIRNLTDEEKVQVVNSLVVYGMDFYENGEYKNFSRVDGAYYIKYGELLERGYKLDGLVTNCEKDDPVIYFFDKVEGSIAPIGAIYDCKISKK